MPIKSPPRLHYHKKRPSKNFIKVYWPYLPLAISIGLNLLVGFNWWTISTKPQTLAYATNVSRQGLLDATNTQRQARSLGALALNSQLSGAAQAKADDMAAKNYWSHQTPEGKQPWDFIESAGYKFQKAGENLAYGFSTNTTTVSGWMNSQSHKDNLLDESFLEVGFGIANMSNYQSQGPQTIVVALYARPLSATLPSNTSTQDNPLQIAPSQQQIAVSDSTVPAKNISFIQALTAGKAPWISALMAAIVGSLATYLALKHTLSLRRLVLSGERFMLKHRLLDITLLSYIVLAFMLNHTVGFIR